MEQRFNRNMTTYDPFGAAVAPGNAGRAQPKRRMAILACREALPGPQACTEAGLCGGGTHFVSNAGGHASDTAIKALIAARRLYGSQEWCVVHHTDCALDTADDAEDPLESAGGPTEAAATGHFHNWRSFAELAQQVTHDVRRIRAHPLVDPSVAIRGYIYDTHAARLIEVQAASEIGRTPD
jgi:carbonic anhydrase